MRSSILAVCLLASLLASAQKTKKVVFKNEIPEYKEVFYVLLDSPDVKHGKYMRTYPGRVDFKETGEYNRGRRTGIWTYEGKDGLEQEIDFDKKKVIFSKPMKSLVSASVVSHGLQLAGTSSDLPVMPGGQSLLNHIFMKYIRYPAEARRRGVDGVAQVSATVTKDGKLVDERIEKGLGYGLDEESLRILGLLPDQWLPAGWGSIPQESRIVIEVRYKLN